LNSEKSFSVIGHLADCQVSNDIFTIELARRLKGTKVTAVCMNPGLVDTDVRKELKWLDRVVRIFGPTVFRWWWQSPAQGAEAPIWLATAPELNGVSGELFNIKSRVQPASAITDPEVGTKLWNISSQMTGL